MERRPQAPETASPSSSSGHGWQSISGSRIYNSNNKAGPGFLERHETALFLVHVAMLIFLILMLLRVYTRRGLSWIFRFLAQRIASANSTKDE